MTGPPRRATWALSLLRAATYSSVRPAWSGPGRHRRRRRESACVAGTADVVGLNWGPGTVDLHRAGVQLLRAGTTRHTCSCWPGHLYGSLT